MKDDRQRLLERYAPRASAALQESAVQETGEPADYQPANAVSGNRNPELMLELRFKQGNSLALSYALLVSTAFNPSQGLTLEFTGHRVRIEGRNLRVIYHALVQHRLAYLQELAAILDEGAESEAVINAIHVETM